MRLIDKVKTNYLHRLVINGMILASSITLILLLENRLFLIIVSVNLFSGLFYLINDLLIIRDKAKIYSIGFKSSNYLGLLIVVILLFILIIGFDYRTYNSSFLWAHLLLFTNILSTGFFQILRGETLLVTDVKIVKFGFGFIDGVTIKLVDIDQVTENENSITIQSINKDYIVINRIKTDPNQTRILLDSLNKK